MRIVGAKEKAAFAQKLSSTIPRVREFVSW